MSGILEWRKAGIIALRQLIMQLAHYPSSVCVCGYCVCIIVPNTYILPLKREAVLGCTVNCVINEL